MKTSLKGFALAPLLLLTTPWPHASAGAPPAGAWGEITGERQSHTSANRAATTVKMIDGSAVVERQPRVRPGMHSVVVHWTPKRGLHTSDRTLRIDVKPCKRYYVNAQFASPGSTLWQAIVDRIEDIPGCKLPSAAAGAAKGG
ncbi:MAG TPA: hypothetical protein VFC24_15235 [Casimicrobiaceae bacterium]|nr:hypothetical protein [Casimicrobiaceae bacterium]